MLFGQKINRIKTLFFIAVAISFASSCKEETSTYRSFTSPLIGLNVKSGNEIEVKVLFGKEKAVDSVVYLIDTTKAISKTDTAAVKLKTEGLNLGNHIITAKIYNGSESDDLTTNVNILSDKAPDLYTYKIVSKFPHDTTAYVEGLEYHDGFFYEGTGEKGNSFLKKIDVKSGKTLQQVKLDTAYFGEGITVVDNKILQITWQEKTAFEYDKNTFKLIKQLPFSVGQAGWGLAFDGEKILNSDGTNTIYYLDKNTYKQIGSIDVYDDKGAISQLNELEVIDGKIYANVYLTNDIVIINPKTGAVEGKIDLNGLFPVKEYFKTDDARGNNVLNGIAYDKASKRLFVAGKKWPYIFEIKISKK
ncbi:glutaminyl-peptide cyclotransferase [Pedobacter aquatilis]|uniref:glutaminyl-peptide cyclotransferase n=1 Tax=Pedobacter aquatilis TaxID=351343 RepID=UPI0025B4A9E2|nr:glutaminyl-peptide cyclotransferase [Pedobacter aquatilis]MDN3585489.1 glutaminyl-peptide cyclotransferase [Pedobacter aquatilis]